jgi:hypothetical protein
MKPGANGPKATSSRNREPGPTGSSASLADPEIPGSRCSMFAKSLV